MNNTAKLAWAAKEGVTPPAFVVAAAASEAHEHDLEHADAPQMASAECCSSHGESCCSASGSCCSQVAHHDHSEHAAPQKSRGITLVHLVSAMRCRGLTVSVALLPPSLPVTCTEFNSCAIVRYAPASPPPLLYDSPYLAVESPPPDRAAI